MASQAAEAAPKRVGAKSAVRPALGCAAAFLLDGLAAYYLLESCPEGEEHGAARLNLAMSVLRAVALWGLGVLAIRFGTGRWPWQRERAARDVVSASAAAQERSAPLIAASDPPAADLESAAPAASQNGNDQRATRINKEIEEQKKVLEDQEWQGFMESSCHMAAYAVVAGCVIRTALVMIADDGAGPAGTLRLVTHAFVIALAYVEFYFVKKLANAWTDPSLLMIEDLHEHPLYWTQIKGYCECSTCDKKIGDRTGGFVALRCQRCKPNQWGHGGFAVCANCFRKQQTQSAAKKGKFSLLRGDKGLKELAPLTASSFVLRMLVLMRPFAGTVLMAMVSVVGSQVTGTYSPKVQGDILNALMKGDTDTFYENIWLFLGLVIVSTVLESTQEYSVSVVIQKLYNHTGSQLYSSLLRQDMAFYDNAMSGQLTSRLTTDLYQAVTPIPNLVNNILANVISLMTGLVVCLATSWRLTMLAFVILSPVIYINRVYSHWARLVQASAYTFVADANACATQAISNIRTVMFSGAEEYERKQHAEHMGRMMNNALKSARGGAGNVLLQGALSQGASFLVLFYGGLLAMRGDGSFEPGSIYTFIVLWNKLSGSFQGLIQNLNEPVKSMSAAQRVFEIIDLEPDICKESHGACMQEQQGIRIECLDVVFAYQKRMDDPAFDGVSFVAEAGETTAVVGKSGCGKSTLTRLLLRFYDPHSGSILINGAPLDTFALPKYRRSIGYVSQETQLFHATIRDNLTYGLEDVDYSMSPHREEVERAARLAKAEEFILDLPEGYSTMLGEGGHDLSGGQRQRLSIARALLRKPKLFLLDEATSALDTENEALVQESLNQVMREMLGRCTIIVIAHRLATVVDAQKIIVLQKGKVVEQGTHEELLKLEGHYKVLVQRQIQKNTTWECPCGEENLTTRATCKACGKAQPAGDEAKTAEKPGEDAAKAKAAQEAAPRKGAGVLDG